MEAALLAFGTFCSTLGGGLVGLRHRDKLHLIMSFTAGVLIAVCFFDILPEAITTAQEQALSLTPLFVAVVAGFLLIHVLERLAILHSTHEQEYAHHTHPLVGRISAAGLSAHSFLDGVGIGLGFHVSPHVGLIIAIAVIAHDFSDGLNTVTLMLANKNTPRSARLFLLLDATTPLLGVLSTYLFGIPASLLVIYLGVFVGFLLYIGASDLLPEAHSEHSSVGMIGLTILGVMFIFIVTRVTG